MQKDSLPFQLRPNCLKQGLSIFLLTAPFSMKKAFFVFPIIFSKIFANAKELESESRIHRNLILYFKEVRKSPAGNPLNEGQGLAQQ